jgi:hypothetical protein
MHHSGLLLRYIEWAALHNTHKSRARYSL